MVTASSSRAEPAREAREQILVAAERVIAERGLGVSLREIALAAGHRNNSAVQYYFSDRDGLVAAVVGYRLHALESDRLERLARLEDQGRADDVAALVAALAVPMMEIPRQHGATHYARFLEQVRAHPAVRSAAAGNSASVRIIVSRLERALGHLPATIRGFRLRALTTALFGWLADRERELERGALDPASDALAQSDLLGMLVSVLLAPLPASASRATRRGARAR